MEGRVKVKLSHHDRDVRMIVEEMPNELRGADLLFSASNGMEIHSVSAPAVRGDEDKLFLRGTHKKSDNGVCGHPFNSDEEAEEFFNRAVVALREFAEALKEGTIKVPEWVTIES